MLRDVIADGVDTRSPRPAACAAAPVRGLAKGLRSCQDVGERFKSPLGHRFSMSGRFRACSGVTCAWPRPAQVPCSPCLPSSR
jgi:hypothetical protein